MTEVETVILLDVDGVLNVGIADPGSKHPLLLSEHNLDFVNKVEDESGLHGSALRLHAVMNRGLTHGDTTYAAFAASNELEVCNELVARLACIINAAGPCAKVIMSSNWRLPQFASRTKQLEDSISAHLGRPFALDGRTRVCKETRGKDRLRTLGDYMESLGRTYATAASRPPNVLVLDDFSITTFRGGSMDLDGYPIRSHQAAAEYLQRRYSPLGTSVARCAVIHTYDEWRYAEGRTLKIGSGLTQERVCEALQFLGQACPHCSDIVRESTTVPDADTWGSLDSRNSSGFDGTDCYTTFDSTETGTETLPHMLNKAYSYDSDSTAVRSGVDVGVGCEIQPQHTKKQAVSLANRMLSMLATMKGGLRVPCACKGVDVAKKDSRPKHAW